MRSQPDVIPINGDRYRLRKTHSYEWEKYNYHFRLIVPAGFEYDGASVPRFLWSITGILPDGLQREAALFHDWIYHHEGCLPKGSYQTEIRGRWLDVKKCWTRKNTDRLFGRHMREASVPKVRRRMAFIAVRLFGRKAWRT